MDNKPDLVTAPSQFLLDTLKARGLFGSVKMIKVSNAIELHDEMVEKDYETLDILYVGGLSRHKGVHLLINAYKLLKSENIKLYIVGKGKDEDGNEEEGEG